MSDKLDQTGIANEMRRAAQLAREHGHPEIAAGNNQIAEYIEGLECAIAAERKLSARRTAERDEARKRIEKLEAELKESQECVQIQCDRINELDQTEPTPTTVENDLMEEIERLQAAAKAREAQLARLRRTVESWSDRGMALVSDVLAELDEVDIPATASEAEEDDA